MTYQPVDLTKRELFSLTSVTVPEKYAGHFRGVLLRPEEIQQGIQRLAGELHAVYLKDSIRRNDYIYTIMMMKGGEIFSKALAGAIKMIRPREFCLALHPLYVPSYKGTTSTGQVNFGDFDFSPLEGQEVLIGEDIIDTGNLMQATLEEVLKHNPRTVRVAALLDKPSRRQFDLNLDPVQFYTGFTIGNHFVVGYGLDLNEQYRDLPFIAVPTPEIIDQANTKRSEL